MARLKRYSRVYKVGDMRFRYDKENCILEYVRKVDAQLGAMITRENEEWRAEFGDDLWEVREGYVVISEIGLTRESWDESPKWWCEVYADELRREVQGYINEFVKEG